MCVYIYICTYIDMYVAQGLGGVSRLGIPFGLSKGLAVLVVWFGT